MAKSINWAKPLTADEEAWVRDRPWLIRDAELSGYTVTFESDDELDDEGTEEEGVVEYETLRKKELQDLIAQRNEDREEDDLIEPASDKNEDLVAALRADDEAHAEEDAEEDEEEA